MVEHCACVAARPRGGQAGAAHQKGDANGGWRGWRPKGARTVFSRPPDRAPAPSPPPLPPGAGVCTTSAPVWVEARGDVTHTRHTRTTRRRRERRRRRGPAGGGGARAGAAARAAQEAASQSGQAAARHSGWGGVGWPREVGRREQLGESECVSSLAFVFFDRGAALRAATLHTPPVYASTTAPPVDTHREPPARLAHSLMQRRRALALLLAAALFASPATAQQAKPSAVGGAAAAATTGAGASLPWGLYHRTDAILEGLRKTALKAPARAR